MEWQVISIIIILLSAFPVGLLLAWLTKEELKDGRKWFLVLAILFIIAATFLSFINFSEKIPAILTLFYISIVSLISVYKSHDKT